jgi:hypothetical protein
MQREKASADGELADPPAFGEPPEPVDDGLLHAAASRAAAAMTVMTAATRGRRSHDGRGPGPRPGQSFISLLLAAGQGDCRFMAASVPAGGGGRITRRR